jgi:hypothetical protein
MNTTQGAGTWEIGRRTLVRAHSGPARANGRSAFGAVAIVAVLLLSAAALYATPAASASSLATTGATHSVSTPGSAISSPATAPSALAGGSSGLQLSPHPSGTPGATGRGTFFNNENLSNAPVANISCGKYYFSTTPYCENTTFDPSINVTSSGELAVAYTVTTDYTHCPSVINITNNTTLDVAVQTSSNGGLSWSSPVYLGNLDCSTALNFSNAWQPSLTSLSNGTLVVTYVEFSVYTCVGTFCYPEPTTENAWPYEMINNQLVVQESYNGGANWTTPQVLNSTFNLDATTGDGCGMTNWPAYHPWISASGNSLYLAWENLSNADNCGGTSEFSAGINFVESTDGGAMWSSPIEMPTIGDGGNPLFGPGGQGTNFSVNPYITVGSNGQVYLAYSTGLGYIDDLCQPGCYDYYTFAMDVVVLNATINGTGATGAWTMHVAAKNEGFDYYEGQSGWGGPGYGIAPQVAYSGLNGQLYVAYQGEAIGTFCYVYTGGSDCYLSYEAAAEFQNSSNGGANWSKPTEIGNLVNPNGGLEQYEYLPSLAVDSNGTIQVSFSLFNESICYLYYSYTYCGAYVQEYTNSTDNGASWSQPVQVSPWVMNEFIDAYRGDYETAAAVPGSSTYFAWTNSACPATIFSCYYGGSPGPETNVTVSWMFSGVGSTVTFHESNLTSAASWSASLLGNIRQAPAGTDLAVSGLPPTERLVWTVPWVNTSYGISWESAAAPTNPASPAAFATNTTLDYTFNEYVLVNVLLNPPMDTYYLTPGYNAGTYSMSPLPEALWAPVNSSVSLSVSPQPISCASFCDFYNLTWLAWTGTGAGSVSSNATSISVPIGTSPVNETANFLFLGYCFGSSGTLTCEPVLDYPLTFHETGLPSGTAWGATVVENSSANGTASFSASGPWLNATTGQTAAQFTLWTVPDGSTGNYWVPTSDPGSPVKEPTQTLVNVTYNLVAPSSTAFAANFTALGLPNATTWSANVGNASYAVTAGNLTVTVPGGTALDLNGSFVYTDTGVGYYAASVAVFPYVVNSTWQNTTTLPVPYTFDGSAHIYVQYEPMFWLTVTSTAGGVVSPASRWVEAGAAVSLNATPNPTYHFLDWTGVGAGASTVLQDHNATTTIHPGAPVSELATFRQNPQPTWNVTLTATGLPTTDNFTFTLGGSTYTASGGSTVIGNIFNGTYGFAATIVYATGSDGTRWVPTGWTASFPVPTPGTVMIQTNGTIQVNYTTQYVLSVATTPNGVVTPADVLGATWQNAGTVVPLVATPAFHYKFAGWNASGPGSVTGIQSSISVTVSAPIWESATFVYRIFPLPAVFWLNVTETGLPNGISWNASVAVGNSSAAGPHSTLTLEGLNGTYSLVVPDVYVGLGVRYVANGSTPISENVTFNRSASVVFAEQFAYTVSASVGGSVAGAGTSWVAAGSSDTLTATPSTGYVFASWNGTGSGGSTPYSGPASSSPVTVNGPTNETATFVPFVPKVTAGSPTAGMAPALGILVVLLVVGLVVGLILGSRRARPPAANPSPEADGAGGSEASDDPGQSDVYGSAPTTPPAGGAADYDEST